MKMAGGRDELRERQEDELEVIKVRKLKVQERTHIIKWLIVILLVSGDLCGGCGGGCKS